MNEIDQYIAEFPVDIQERLQTVRKAIKEEVPEAEEAISYQIPTFKLKKKNLVHFAGFKNHIGFYPTPKGIEEFEDELSKYKQGKGSVQFPHNQELPLDLIRRMVRFLKAKTG
jgi:uncharacterized protein YdhG (YjbR/CyaY superfamily)